MLIVGIDAGYVNFAICALHSDKPKEPVHWTNEPLFTGDFTEEKLCAAVYAWIRKPEIAELLKAADVIVLERQMTMKFQAINHCVRFLYFEKTKEVNPMTMASLFGLPKLRKDKKKAAVELVSFHVLLPIKKGKKDDLCDAYLLAMSHLQQKNPKFFPKWQGVAKEPASKKIKK